jgi:hypothetical protein
MEVQRTQHKCSIPVFLKDNFFIGQKSCGSLLTIKKIQLLY